MRSYSSIGIQVPDILLPNKKVNMAKWAVIACDQFTSQPDYWQKVAKIVGKFPSTLNLFLPEVYLGKPQEKTITVKTRQTMKIYLKERIISPKEGMIYVERKTKSGVRHGLMLALDLENYDYNKGSKSLIRATEGTILDRLPPRIKIRKDAIVELPHILVLIDDRKKTVIEPIKKNLSAKDKIYDFELMLGSGHLKGYQVGEKSEKRIVKALEKLANLKDFKKKYNLTKAEKLLLYAVGDGNHSLATAKAVWEMKKKKVGIESPLRYALIELENIHDKGLFFEPIHRVIFDVKRNIKEEMTKYYSKNIEFIPLKSLKEIKTKVEKGQNVNFQTVGLISSDFRGVAKISKPKSNLAVGTLQSFLDGFLVKGHAKSIDYIHGDKEVYEMGIKKNNFGFILPTMDKNELFRTVILDGALPRKTFSMGEAKEKRFYLECRQIQ